MARTHPAVWPSPASLSLASCVTFLVVALASLASAESLVRSDNNSLDIIPEGTGLTDEPVIDMLAAFGIDRDSEIRLRPWNADMDAQLASAHGLPPAGQGKDGVEFKQLGHDFNGVPVQTLLAGLESALQRPDEELECLAYTLYFEARGESVSGQRAVANVILNRRASPHYPDTICGVIRQGGYSRYQCQFTYHCDGLEENIHEIKAYYAIKRLAREILDAKTLDDATDGATHYHTVDVQPFWASNLTRTTRIGSHIFYKS